MSVLSPIVGQIGKIEVPQDRFSCCDLWPDKAHDVLLRMAFEGHGKNAVNAYLYMREIRPAQIMWALEGVADIIVTSFRSRERERTQAIGLPRELRGLANLTGREERRVRKEVEYLIEPMREFLLHNDVQNATIGDLRLAFKTCVRGSSMEGLLVEKCLNGVEAARLIEDWLKVNPVFQNNQQRLRLLKQCVDNPAAFLEIPLVKQTEAARRIFADVFEETDLPEGDRWKTIQKYALKDPEPDQEWVDEAITAIRVRARKRQEKAEKREESRDTPVTARLRREVVERQDAVEKALNERFGELTDRDEKRQRAKNIHEWERDMVISREELLQRLENWGGTEELLWTVIQEEAEYKRSQAQAEANCSVAEPEAVAGGESPGDAPVQSVSIRERLEQLRQPDQRVYPEDNAALRKAILSGSLQEELADRPDLYEDAIAHVMLYELARKGFEWKAYKSSVPPHCIPDDRQVPAAREVMDRLVREGSVVRREGSGIPRPNTPVRISPQLLFKYVTRAS